MRAFDGLGAIKMKRFVALLPLCLLSGVSYSSPLIGYFYEVNVNLTNGKTIGGNSWGIGWIGGGSFQEQKISKVNLKSTAGSITATFFLSGNDTTRSFVLPVQAGRGQEHSLELASHYQYFDRGAGATFFWAQETTRIPLSQITSIETVKVIGRGQPVSDPRPYQNVREPFVTVEDCGRGCPVKPFSRDATVTRDDLSRLWTQTLGCNARTPDADKGKLIKQYQLEFLSDPFCTD